MSAMKIALACPGRAPLPPGGCRPDLQAQLSSNLRCGIARFARIPDARFEQIEVVAEIVHLFPQPGKLSPQRSSRRCPADLLRSANHMLAFDV